MKLADTHHARPSAATVAALVLAVLGGTAVQASPREDPWAAHTPQSAPAARDRAKPQIVYGSTLFATWGTVTNGTSSANAAEHRKELTGGHAGSANAAEAPAFRTFGP